MHSVGNGDAAAAWKDLKHATDLRGSLATGRRYWKCCWETSSINSHPRHLSFRTTKPDTKRLEACLRDLKALPPTAEVSERVEFGERIWALDSIMVLDRQGFAQLKTVFAKEWNRSG